jgi:hypothetical protein
MPRVWRCCIPWRQHIRCPRLFAFIALLVSEISQVVYCADPLLESAKDFRADFQLSIPTPLASHASAREKNGSESTTNRKETANEGSKESLHAASLPAARSWWLERGYHSPEQLSHRAQRDLLRSRQVQCRRDEDDERQGSLRMR